MVSLIERIYNGMSRFRGDVNRQADRLSGIFNGVAIDRLSNGMGVRVKSAPGHATARCAVTIYSGGHDDPAGKEGLAHLLEHVIFESAGMKDRLADFKKRGGTFSACTGPHDTHYIFDCIADRRESVETMCRLAADAVFHNAIREQRLGAEKDVVRSESAMYRARERNNVAGYLYAAAYGISEDKYSNLGTSESLAAIDVDDLRHFHALHYTPANASLDITSPLPVTATRMGVVKIFDTLEGGPVPAHPEPKIYRGGYKKIAAQDVGETTLGVALPLPRPPPLSAGSMTQEVLAAYLSAATYEALRLGEERHGYACSAYVKDGLMILHMSCVPAQASSMQSFMAGLLQDVAAGRIDPDRFSESVAGIRFRNLRSRDTELADGAGLLSPYFTKYVSRHALEALKAVQPDDIAGLLRTALRANPTLAVIGDGPGLMSFENFAAALKGPGRAQTQPQEISPH